MATTIRTITPEPGDILPFTATEATLENGLRVFVVPTGLPNIVSLQIPVQTGSRNEIEPGKSGFAHFFEHMMFRGTVKYPAHAYQEIITRSGARQNAYTTDDYTNYHITFAAEDLEKILEIEADRFMNLEYSEEDFRTEARAILGEYNKSASDPITKLIEVQREHAYQVHTYQHTTMGFIRDIEDMPNQFEYSRLFFDRWYRPEYSAVIVAGDVEPAKVVALVEKYWSAWKAGSFRIDIQQEKEFFGPIVAHHPWPTATLPLVAVGFHGPAFSETENDYAALDALLDLHFGDTSDLYRRLVEHEQKVDQFFPYLPANQDPALATIIARVKDPADAAYVRELVLDEVARARKSAVSETRLQEAKSYARYAFARTLDNSESIASTLARFVRYRRAYESLNNLYRIFDTLTPADLQAAAQKYLADERLVQTTLAHGDLPSEVGTVNPVSARQSALATTTSPAYPVIRQQSQSGLVRFKLQFGVGSAHDPAGKQGLAALSAAMISEAGSSNRRIDEITRALFPMAGSFDALVDKEMTTFTGVIHRDNLDRFAEIVLEQLTSPGMREADFARLHADQRNGLLQDLRSNNDEELGKERLQALAFAGTPYEHPVLGTVSGIDSLTIEDVQTFIATNFTRANLTVGLAGDVPDAFVERLNTSLALLPEGAKATAPIIAPRQPAGLQVEIVAKETRATALSFGHPLTVTRTHPDFAALWVARSWLGEHRASQGRLFQQLREIRGMNYGNYAYIEAFPRGMYQFFPETNIARRAQLFEIWVRPVPPEQAVFAFKAALHQLDLLIAEGLSEDEFQATREYLAKNVFLLTKTQDQQLGAALDSRWFAMGEFVTTIRAALARLTRDQVNEAVRRHLSATNLHVVFVAPDTERLRGELLSGAFTEMKYEVAKPGDVVAEDVVIGNRALGLAPDAVTITPVDEVFA